MKKVLLSFALLSVMFSACSDAEPAKEETKEPVVSEEEVVEEEEIVEEVAPSIEDFIKGEWNQIGKSCDEEGNNCQEMSKESTWSFKGDSVTWSGFTHPYNISADTILIAGSPYMVVSEMTDTITFRAVKTNRYMKLAKM